MIISMCDYSKLIVITNRQLCSGDFLEQLKMVARLQPRAIILREKDLDLDAYIVLAQKVKLICQEAKVPLFIHGHIAIARKLNCSSIHLPFGVFAQESTELKDFQEISVSCHSLEEALIAARLGATQIVLGTIFATQCKPGKAGAGLGFVQEVCRSCSIPVYAIGGINPQRLKDVLKAGAAGGCMMSGFMQMSFL